MCGGGGGVCGGALQKQTMLLISALVHLLNLYLCALLLFSSLLLSYCHPCPRIAVRRNDKNREISRKTITVICSAGIQLSVWVDGAGIYTGGNQTHFSGID